MSFLQLEGKTVLVFGISNRKSVAFHIANVLNNENARLICSVQNEEQALFVRKSFPDAEVFICNLEDEGDIKAAAGKLTACGRKIHGVAHSVAFANFADGMKPFHQISKADFMQSVDISCFSLISIANHFKPLLEPDGAIVTVSISTTRMAAESYSYMAPVKAALDSSVVFLAKSLSEDTKVRVNAVGASLLKTSSSAGIPGYLKPYLFAEMATLRKESLKTDEVANVAAFLLSPRSSGINAQTVVVDAGMSCNFFDRRIVEAATELKKA